MAKGNSKSKYYSLNNILKNNAVYNVIIGERSNGKTYSVLKYAVEHYFKTGGRLAVIRRWSEDIKGRRASDMFSALLHNNEIEKLSEGKYTGITYYAGKWYMCNYDEKGKAIYNDSDLFAYAFSLSDTEHNKSISYPTVEIVLFDEFLTRQVYLQNEFVLFMNTLSTIIRDRTNVQIFMLGNTVNKYSPYFVEMGLSNVENQKQGTIDIYKYGDSKLTVAVEYCDKMGEEKKNNYYFAFDNPKLNMIKTGAWELDLYPHLMSPYKPKDILFTFFIEFNFNLYQCEIINLKNQLFIYIHDKTTPLKNPDKDLVYSLEHNPKVNYNRNVLKPAFKIGTKIAALFSQGKVFYQDNTVGDAINNYLNNCKRIK